LSFGIPAAVGYYGEDEDNYMARCIQFTTVWNNLLGKTSSKIKDLHGVLANLLDFSAKEILQLPIQERMKAIIRSHKILPLDILFCSLQDYSSPQSKSGDAVEDKIEERWLPQLPTGSPLCMLTESPDLIARVTDSGLQLHDSLFSTGKLRCLELKFEHSTRPYKFVLTVDNRQLWVELRCSNHDPEPRLLEGKPLLLVQRPLKAPRVSGYGYLGYGALLYSTKYESDGRTLSAIYDCPVVYGLFKGVCTNNQFSGAEQAECVSEIRGQNLLIASGMFILPLHALHMTCKHKLANSSVRYQVLA
jgi:hypothetical protein